MSSSNNNNETLYLRNLDEKIHPDRLRSILYSCFSRFGSVLDIVCSRRNKLRGQAWIVFRTADQAQLAKDYMQGATLFGKPVTIEFSENKSDAIAKLQGTYKPRDKQEHRKVEQTSAPQSG